MLDEYGVALHGQSFRQRETTENLASAYPEPIAGRFNIGVLHTGLGGMGGHANYAPCTIEDLLNKGYHYWALAHVHQAALLHEHPHVVYCGNLQGRHIKESGAKGASLVAVDDGRIESVAALHVDVVRWAHVPVRVDRCATIAETIDCIGQGIEAAVTREAEGRLLACRIELSGCTALHGALLGSTERLLAEARAAALGFGEDAAWIERVLIATTGPEAVGSRKDAIGDLQRMMSIAPEEPTLHEQLSSELGEFVRKLPHEVRTDPDDGFLISVVNEDMPDVITQAANYLTARLSAEKV